MGSIGISCGIQKTRIITLNPESTLNTIKQHPNLTTCVNAANLHNGETQDGFVFRFRPILLDRALEEATGQLAKMRRKTTRRKAKVKTRTARRDPLYVDGERPRPMYVDYKDVELLKKLINRHGRIVGRRKTGSTAISQHAITESIKRARFMALLPFLCP